jgi:hypothetical protein
MLSTIFVFGFWIRMRSLLVTQMAVTVLTDDYNYLFRLFLTIVTSSCRSGDDVVGGPLLPTNYIHQTDIQTHVVLHETKTIHLLISECRGGRRRKVEIEL